MEYFTNLRIGFHQKFLNYIISWCIVGTIFCSVGTREIQYKLKHLDHNDIVFWGINTLTNDILAVDIVNINSGVDKLALGNVGSGHKIAAVNCSTPRRNCMYTHLPVYYAELKMNHLVLLQPVRRYIFEPVYILKVSKTVS